jgi:hypothetical protein
MRHIFQNSDLNQRFVTDGYVVLPFLAPAEIADLRQIFADMHPGELPPFYVTASPDVTDRQHRQAVYDAAKPFFEPKLAALFNGYKLGGAFFFVKQPAQPLSEVPMHVDPSFVDERQFNAVVFWCPLVDVDASNGCLAVVPGSYRHVGPLRPYGGAHPFQNVQPLLQTNYTRQVEMTAGDIIFYESKMFHGSGPNMGNERRVSIGGGLAPQDAQLQYSVMVSPSQAEVYEVDKEFYWSYQPGARPAGVKTLGTVVHHVDQLSEADVLQSAHIHP